MICGQTCDELYHFTFYLIVLGYPLDYAQRSTKSTLAMLAVKLSVSAIIYPRWTATAGQDSLYFLRPTVLKMLLDSVYQVHAHLVTSSRIHYSISVDTPKPSPHNLSG